MAARKLERVPCRFGDLRNGRARDALQELGQKLIQALDADPTDEAVRAAKAAHDEREIEKKRVLRRCSGAKSHVETLLEQLGIDEAARALGRGEARARLMTEIGKDLRSLGDPTWACLKDVLADEEVRGVAQAALDATRPTRGASLVGDVEIVDLTTGRAYDLGRDR